MEILRNLPFADYGKREGINASLLKIVHKKSLLHARAYLDGIYAEESDTLDFGHCFHSLALEGREDFVERPATYAAPANHAKVKKGEIKIGDPLPWNANAAACEAWEAEQGDLIPLSASSVARLRGMTAAVHSAIRPEWRAGDVELSMFAEKDGVALKCRADLIPRHHEAPIIDLKSCQSAEPAKFMRSALDLGYHIQAAFALDVARLCGMPRKSFWIVAVESEAPHAMSVLKFDDVPLSFTRLGRIHYRAALAKIVNARKTGVWSDYGTSAAEEYASAWMLKELELTA